MAKIKLKFGEYYHIYNRGNNQETIFKEQRNYFYYLYLYKKYILPIADLYAYCLLPNHFHLLLRIKTEDEVSDQFRFEDQLWRQFRTFLGTYVKTINKTYSRSGHLFEGRYSRKLVQEDSYFCNLIVYIHQNPQYHGIVSDYTSWPFSSFQIYLRKDPRSIITQDLICNDDLYTTIMEMHKDPIKGEISI